MHTHTVSSSYLQVPHYGFNKLWIKNIPPKERVEYMESVTWKHMLPYVK